MTNILCEKPKYILNPAFKDALLQTEKYALMFAIDKRQNG